MPYLQKALLEKGVNNFDKCMVLDKFISLYENQADYLKVLDMYKAINYESEVLQVYTQLCIRWAF